MDITQQVLLLAAQILAATTRLAVFILIFPNEYLEWTGVAACRRSSLPESFSMSAPTSGGFRQAGYPYLRGMENDKIDVAVRKR